MTSGTPSRREPFQEFSPPAHGLTWAEYLEGFHERRPGITEDVLARSTARGLTPYGWIADPLPETGVVLDLACGSAPLARLFERGRWVGTDRSPAELDRAARGGAGPLVRADATALPFATGAFDGVVCSMAIMLLQPLDAVLAEIRRVVVNGGISVFMLPGSRPLRVVDLLRYLRLMIAVGRTHLAYPNDRPLIRSDGLLRRAGFEVVADERLRFEYAFEDEGSTRRFVDSLYLPAVPERRVADASRAAAGWVGRRIGIPLRRMIVRAT